MILLVATLIHVYVPHNLHNFKIITLHNFEFFNLHTNLQKNCCSICNLETMILSDVPLIHVVTVAELERKKNIRER